MEQYTCNVCHATFKQSGHLARHKESVHGASTYECQACFKRFNRKDNLKRHEESRCIILHPKIARKRDVQRDETVAKSSTVADRSVAAKSDAVPKPDTVPEKRRRVDQSQDEPPMQDGELGDIYKRYWQAIRTYRRNYGRVQQIHNLQLSSVNTRDVEPALWDIFESQKNAFKINFSYGFVLIHNETSDLRYYHASQNNARLFDMPKLVRNKDDFKEVLEAIAKEDILEYVRQQRPDTKWVVHIVTNLAVYINKIYEHPIGSRVILPDYLVKNKSVIGLVYDNRTGKAYEDNLCVFRCIALAMGYTVKNFVTIVQSLYRKYHKSDKEFAGVKLSDLSKLEKLYQININVWQIDETGTAELLRRSDAVYTDTANVNMYENHFSYIKNLDLYCKSYKCNVCDQLWKDAGQLHRHQATCTLGVRHEFTGGVYHTPKTIWEELEEVGIDVAERFYPYRATYDIEVYFNKEDLPTASEKNTWIARHNLLSISVASNVPGYEDPVCYVTDGESSKVVDAMLERLENISETANAILCEKYAWVFEELDALFKEEMEDQTEEKKAGSLRGKLESYLHQLPVVSFNGGRYDLNVLKKDLMQRLDCDYIIKKGHDYMCIATDTLRFLDITNYLAAGSSYEKYIKAYGCTAQKGFYPYEWMDDLNKLDYPALPPQDAFYSQLKKSGISDEDYCYLQSVWQDQNMKTVRDLLVWYNNLDVTPMLEAVAKQSAFYAERNIDMLKDGISLPGLCLKYLFTFLDRDTVFGLVDKKNDDFYHKMRDNVTGGPSIVFHRHHHANQSKIREAEYGDEARLCQRILGLDANALYLYAIMQDMPTGFFTRYKVEESGVRAYPQQKYGRMACEWLEHIATETGLHIQHMKNNREKRIAGLSVDGWCSATKTVYQFHGCYWHGCPCQGPGTNKTRQRSFEDLREDTRKCTERIQEAGYKVIEMWECEWRKICPQPTQHQQPKTTQDILKGVRDDSLFGMVECDIHVPDHLKDYFKEMPPIFKNTDIRREDIGDFMRQYAEANKIMSQPRRSLIGSYFGKKILLCTPLLKWYLSHGLVVTKIYEYIQFEPKPCFKPFGDAVSEARREGDQSPEKAIIADSMKLLGNSSYGKTITNVLKHTEVTYCDEDTAQALVNSKRFKKMDQVTEHVYEVEQLKKVVKINLPYQIGFTVYQYAKLRMLEMYYDFMLKYVDRRNFEMVEMDTDSLYFAIAGPSFDAVIKKELLEDYYRNRHHFLPAEACPAHQELFVQTKTEAKSWLPPSCCENQCLYDQRTPGLFKLEFEGEAIIALCSKTYYCVGEKNKLSTKGLSKRQNCINYEMFLDVLREQKNGGGQNRGFRVNRNDIFTYTQTRDALSYFYCKRQVLKDGVSTVPLNV